MMHAFLLSLFIVIAAILHCLSDEQELLLFILQSSSSINSNSLSFFFLLDMQDCLTVALSMPSAFKIIWN